MSSIYKIDNPDNFRSNIRKKVKKKVSIKFQLKRKINCLKSTRLSNMALFLIQFLNFIRIKLLNK